MAHLLDSLPGSLVVVDPGGRILQAAGACGPLGALAPFGSKAAEIVGARLVDLLSGADPAALGETLQMVAGQNENVVVGPLPIRYEEESGMRRATSLLAVNRLKDPEVRGVCVLLLPDSTYDRLDDVLVQVAGGQFQATFGLLADALRHPPASCEAYFLMSGDDGRDQVRIPDLHGVPGPPLPGPWDAAVDNAEPLFSRLVGELPPQTGEAARKAGFSTVSCFPTSRGADGKARACLVAWSRRLGRPDPSALAALERAAAIVALALSHASMEGDVKDASYRDPLTGLGNEVSLLKELERQLAAGERPAVMCIDLDGFRPLNERLGALAGDTVLRVTARRLASVMRPTDEVARTGPDEFAVVCGGGLSRDEVAAIAERVVEQLSRPLTVSDRRSVDTGASVGVAIATRGGMPAAAVLAEAERALAEAKSRGRGKWRIISD